MPNIPVIPDLPFLVSSECRSRLTDGMRRGIFVFPPSIDPVAVANAIWVDREELLQSYPELSDPLVEFIGSTHGATNDISSTFEREIFAARNMGVAGSEFGCDLGTNLCTALIAARQAYGFSEVEIRRVAAQTDVPTGEVSTLYPDPDKISNLLAVASSAITGLQESDVALSAIFAYCAVIHCHAFSDGNKRTARVLWAKIIAPKGRDAVPLALLSNLNRSSFIIQFRRVLLFGNWEPLIVYLSIAAEACFNWMQAKIDRGFIAEASNAHLPGATANGRSFR